MALGVMRLGEIISGASVGEGEREWESEEGYGVAEDYRRELCFALRF